jgi:subtilisin family serine protease
VIWNLSNTVWNTLGTRGQSIRVAIIDSGFYPHHSFISNVVSFESVIPYEHAQHDPTSHGTHVTGIVHQVAPHAQLICIKALPSNQSEGHPKWIAAGIKRAMELNADIIQLSMGGSNDDTLYKVVHEALAAGVFIVCAASNNGQRFRSNIAYPAAYGSVLCVGSHDDNGQTSAFSPTGREIDLLAPGENIESAFLLGITGRFYGTSQASPFVAGLMALLLSFDRPNSNRIKNMSHMKTVLKAMTTKPGEHSNSQGHGVLDPNELLQWGQEHLQKLLNTLE